MVDVVQLAKAIRTSQKFISDTETPGSGAGGRDLLRRKVFSILCAYNHGECIVKAQGGKPDKLKTLQVSFFDLYIRLRRVAGNLLFQNNAAGCPGIFGIDVDVALAEGSMGQECSAQVQFPFNALVKLSFNLLSCYFAEDQLLSEVLRADDNGSGAAARTKACYSQQECNGCLHA